MEKQPDYADSSWAKRDSFTERERKARQRSAEKRLRHFIRDFNNADVEVQNEVRKVLNG